MVESNHVLHIPVDDRLEAIIVYAERYALGRSTYAVDDVCTFIDALIPNIETRTLQVILRDISSKISGEETFGMDMDRRKWFALEFEIRCELKRRGLNV